MKIVSEGVNNFLAFDNPNSRDTESFRLGIIGGSGSGKTLTAMRMIGDLIERGYIVISLNDKGTIEHGACMLPEKYITGKLKARLNKHNIIPTQLKAKIIHHLTTNVPNRVSTKIHFKSIPIKELLEKTDSLLYYLCGGLSQQSTMKILKNAIKLMKDNENWYHLTYKYLNKMIERKQKQLSSTQTENLVDEENFFMKGVKSSQIQNLDTLLRNFMFLKESPIFQPSNNPFNFDFEKDIIKSKEKFIILTDCFEQEDNTAGVLFQIFILTQIIKHKRKYDNKLCILIDEGSKFAPSGLDKNAIENIMARLLLSFLNNYSRSYRTSAIICNQSRETLNPRLFKGNCLSHQLYGKNDSQTDINTIANIFRFDNEARRFFTQELKDFHYLGFKIEGYDASTSLNPIYIFPPEFPTTDEGVNTEEELAINYPHEDYSKTLLPLIIKMDYEQKQEIYALIEKERPEQKEEVTKEIKEYKKISEKYELVAKLDKKIPDSRTKVSEIAKITNYSSRQVRNILKMIREEANV